MYALESCKSVDVASKLSHLRLDYSFRRALRGGAEQDHFIVLTTQVEGVSLVNMRDRWIWSLEVSGDFSVTSVRKLIDDKMLPEGKTNPSLFIYQRGSDIAYLLLYVDDIIFTALSLAFLQRVIASLHGEFVVTDLGSLTYFLGISAQRSFTGLFLSQSTYADEIRERAHMQEYNSCRTHVDTESKLGADGEPLTVQAAPMSTSTSQPTCLSDASTLAGFFPVQLVRSTSGYCVFLDDNLFSWSANRQVTFSRSSVKAEYIGVANVVAEAGWVTQ
ncbi:ribonuclease H-like domain-containing protein [Tanacetum coccineum]|uniref:Ribonuclease H-like domain-containing protein n=1 Tax=Tanacetum coccineum TaxID=301880 RepID=A0ABQ5I7E1_9ASTR